MLLPGSAARKRGSSVHGVRDTGAAIGCWRDGKEALIQEPSPATPEEDAVIGPCEALLRALF